MQNQSMRWKGLMGPRAQSSQNISRQKPKKYTPTRTLTSSDLNKKIKAVNSSRINTSSDGQIAPREHQSQQKSLLIKGVEVSEYKMTSPRRSGSELNLAMKLKPTTNTPGDELASPTVLIKQLRQINKSESSNIPVKALFSLDQQHRYIHQQLFKIKTDFTKLKQVVMEELVNYKKQIDLIVKKIMTQLQEVMQACGVNHMPVSLFDQPNNNLRESTKFAPFQNMQMESLNLSIIKKQSSMGESKAELKKLFGEQSARIQKMLNCKVSESLTDKPKYEPAKTDRIQTIGSANVLRKSPKLPSHKSKKQFEKLFEAVNSLKRDMKGLDEMKIEIKINKKQAGVSSNGKGQLRRFQDIMQKINI